MPSSHQQDLDDVIDIAVVALMQGIKDRYEAGDFDETTTDASERSASASAEEYITASGSGSQGDEGVRVIRSAHCVRRVILDLS